MANFEISAGTEPEAPGVWEARKKWALAALPWVLLVAVVGALVVDKVTALPSSSSNNFLVVTTTMTSTSSTTSSTTSSVTSTTTSVSTTSRTTTSMTTTTFVVSCTSARQTCLPGHDHVGWGFDILVGDLPQRPSPAIQLTYTQGRTYACPLDSSIVWDVPDQFQIVDGSSLEQSSQTFVAYSATQVAQSLSAGISLGIDIPLPDFTLSLNPSVSSASSSLQQRQSFSAFTHSTRFGVVYQVVLQDNAQATREFTQDVQSLPPTYSSSTSADYMSFIQKYGTHHVIGGFFGGYAMQEVAVNANWGQTETESSISAQADIHFDFSIGVQGNDSNRGFQQSGRYQSEFSELFVGGLPEFADQGLSAWNQWIQSYYQKPALIYKDTHKITLREHSALIEPRLNQTARSLSQAIQDYIRLHPYPPDPECMQGVMTMQGACCPTTLPFSCGSFRNSCYNPVSSKCCGRQVIPNNQKCCETALTPFACQASQTCCGQQCLSENMRCCDQNTGATCLATQTCCAAPTYACMDYNGECCGPVNNVQWACPQWCGCGTTQTYNCWGLTCPGYQGR